MRVYTVHEALDFTIDAEAERFFVFFLNSGCILCVFNFTNIFKNVLYTVLAARILNMRLAVVPAVFNRKPKSKPIPNPNPSRKAYLLQSVSENCP